MQYVRQISSRLIRTIGQQTVFSSTKQLSTSSNQSMRPIAYWMFGCAGMSAGAIFLGGVTRLTESGLSMTSWRFIKDMKLPSSEEEWEEEFETYKKFPEWELLNKERQMTLSQFKFIYFMEFFHRIWGRATGLVFLVPLVYFYPRIAAKGGRRAKIGLATMTGLMGFQGFLGWYMVRSGLDYETLQDNIPRVSQYRLTAHLTAALALYGSFLWTGIHMLNPKSNLKGPLRPRILMRLSLASLGLSAVTIISGGFVAGLDAGLVHNTYPTSWNYEGYVISWAKMSGSWIPSDYWSPRLSPVANMFQNPSAVQFNHRLLATVTFGVISATGILTRRVAILALPSNVMLGLAGVQFTLGIATLLFQVPVSLASAHQMGAVGLFSSVLYLIAVLLRLPKP